MDPASTAVYRVTDPDSGSSVEISREICNNELYAKVEKWARWAGMERGIDHQVPGERETHGTMTNKLLAFLATNAHPVGKAPAGAAPQLTAPVRPPVEVQLAAPAGARPTPAALQPAPVAARPAPVAPAPAAPRPARVSARPAPASPAPASPRAAPAAAARPARRRAAPAARSVAAVMTENLLRKRSVTNDVLRKLLDNRKDQYGARDTKDVLINILVNVEDEDLPTEDDIEAAKDDLAVEKEFLARMQKCSLAEKRATLSRQNTPAI
jgi:hypothetical protein